ncbi:MAG: alpha/beta hydrolase [Actinomycetota bacterium]|nr:alpha/beta hydrolase [Actinomycetota bacterium]
MKDRELCPYLRTRTGRRPLIALHGLGGSSAQPMGLLDPEVLEKFDVIAPDLRAHGSNRMPVDDSHLTFAGMAADVRDLIEALDLSEPPVIMGISMGAGIALELQSTSEQYAALLLVRPAWAWESHSANLDVFLLIAHLMDEYQPAEARARFSASSEYAQIAEVSPAAAQALLPQFDAPLAVERRLRLRALPADHPRRPTAPVPGIVLGSNADPVHPIHIAQRVATDTSMEFDFAPPRYDEPEAHRAAISSALLRVGEGDIR